MKRVFLTLVGATSLTLAACGAEAGKDRAGAGPEDVGASDEVGVSTSELTNCTRTELANVVVTCHTLGNSECAFRLMENNFVCAEGVVGQASTEPLSADGDHTFTTVATKLFGQPLEGKSDWGTVTIATQWGHAYASQHETHCWDGYGWLLGTWHMDPWSKKPVLHPGSECLP